MSDPCVANPTVARKSLTLLLQRLASVGQNDAADAIKVSETLVSRLKSDHSENFTALLAALGLKIVPSEYRCYDPEHVEHLQYFARIGMRQEVEPLKLEWDEEQPVVRAA